MSGDLSLVPSLHSGQSPRTPALMYSDPHTDAHMCTHNKISLGESVLKLTIQS